MRLKELNVNDIESMSYNELIGLVKETNRPPGGTPTIAATAQSCFLGPGRTMLEIGTATGVTAVEMAQITGCSITAIDINQNSLDEAIRRAKEGKVDHLINFQKEDATHLSFDDEMFDVVFCGNVTSLVSNRKKALAEYARVLKPGGLLSGIPMYYIKNPSEQLIQDVSNAIQVNIKPHDKAYWIDLFENENFKILSCHDYAFKDIPESMVKDFCKEILNRPHLRDLPDDSKEALDKLYNKYMQLFRFNLAHMGYSILTLSKVDKNIDRELFTANPVV